MKAHEMKKFDPNSVCIFIHGGPGFNSFAEERILGPRFQEHGQKAIFWNEPHASQTQYQDWRDSIEAVVRQAENCPVHIISHSFSIYPLMDLLVSQKITCEKLSLIAPAFDLNQAYRNVLKIAIQDFQKNESPRADELKKLLSESAHLYDPAMRAGFGVAAHDPELFFHYWTNVDARAEFFDEWMKRGVQIDPSYVDRVLSGISGRNALPAGSVLLDLPVKVAYGKNDPLIQVQSQPDPAIYFKSFQKKTFAESAHFPHLEEPDLFLSWVLET
jgi:pimeloyl-ACP methyl ester carboxylesterase